MFYLFYHCLRSKTQNLNSATLLRKQWFQLFHELKQWFQRQYFSWLQGVWMINIFVWCLFAWALNRVENWNQIHLHAIAAVCVLALVWWGTTVVPVGIGPKIHVKSGQERRTVLVCWTVGKKWIAMSQIIMFIVKREDKRYKQFAKSYIYLTGFVVQTWLSIWFNSWSTWSACWKNSDNETILHKIQQLPWTWHVTKNCFTLSHST